MRRWTGIVVALVVITAGSAVVRAAPGGAERSPRADPATGEAAAAARGVLAQAGPTAHGTLTIQGTLQDGSVLSATGVTWTPESGSGVQQSVSYAWRACGSSGCRALSTPPHQPYIDTALLGPGDVGLRLFVRETATDDLDGSDTSASVTAETADTVAPWPASAAPAVSFVYGLPPSQSASNREYFEFAPHSSTFPVSVYCAIDSQPFPSTPCRTWSRSSAGSYPPALYLTPVLSPGRHTVHLLVADANGERANSYSWTVTAMPAPTACSSCFEPPHLDSSGHPMSWNWQLQGTLDLAEDSGFDMFDVDGFTTTAAQVAAIHALAGRTLAHEKAICYIDLGSWEDDRPDQGSWPRAALGLTLPGYAQEHWVDLRQLPALLGVIDERMKLCQSKGFDGVEVDNIDGWDGFQGNYTGFPLTPQDAEAWLAAIANEAHSLNMFVLWKNNPDLASFGLRYFDGALDEQCFEYMECTTQQTDGNRFFPGLTCNTTTLQCGVGQFAAAGKWVGEVEYKFGVAGEDGVVCDPGQSCTLQIANGAYTELPYSTFCNDVYALSGFGLAAWRAFESDQLDGTHSFYCWK